MQICACAQGLEGRRACAQDEVSGDRLRGLPRSKATDGAKRKGDGDVAGGQGQEAKGKRPRPCECGGLWLGWGGVVTGEVRGGDSGLAHQLIREAGWRHFPHQLRGTGSETFAERQPRDAGPRSGLAQHCT